MDEAKTTLEEEEEVASKEVKACIPPRTPPVVKFDDDDNVNGNTTTYSYAYGSTSGGGGGGGVRSVRLPEIEATVSHTTLQLRIWCVRRKGILADIYREAEEHHMNVINTNVFPFQTSGLDLTHITLIAQMEETQENEKHVEDLVESLHSIL